MNGVCIFVPMGPACKQTELVRWVENVSNSLIFDRQVAPWVILALATFRLHGAGNVFMFAEIFLQDMPIKKQKRIGSIVIIRMTEV